MSKKFNKTKAEKNTLNIVIIVLVSFLAIISLTALGINYFMFIKAEEDDARIFTPSLSSKTISNITYEMTENYLTVKNFKASSNLEQQSGEAAAEPVGNNIKMYLDFGSFHCKRLFLSNLDTIKTLLNQEEDISFDFVFVNYFGARSTTNWSENSAAIMALIANNYPEEFFNAAQLFFQFQPAAINGETISMNESISFIADRLEIPFTSNEIEDLNDGYYLRWTNDIVNKYASKNNVSVLPTITFNGEVLRDPAVDTPKTLGGLLTEEGE